MMNDIVKPITEDFLEYLKDESRTSGTADTISFPRNENEVVMVMKELYSEDIPITIQGARTGLAAGAVPNGGHVMNLSRMDSATSMRRDRKGFFHVSVQPGMILSNLRENITGRKFDTNGWCEKSMKTYFEFCKDREQFFSPDPTEASATIGGMVACNASGARSYLYGSTRKHVTAVRMVLYNGDTICIKRGEYFAKGRSLCLSTEQGGEMDIKLPEYCMPKTKNASGYFVEDNMDAIDLFIGSDGTLGILTEIELRLLPLPEYIWGVSCFFEDKDDSISFVCDMRRNMENIAAIEYFDGNAMNILKNQKRKNPGFSRLPDIIEGMDAAVYVELHCMEEEDAVGKLMKLGSILENSGGNSENTWVARNNSDRDILHFFRHTVPESVNMLIDQRKIDNPSIAKLGTDMSVPNDKLMQIMDLYENMLNEYGLQSAIWGHIGDNHLHVNILPRNEEEYDKGKELYGKWAEIVTEMGGAVSAEHGVGKLKSDFLTVMYGEKHINEMAELKMEFDPMALIGAGNMFTPLKRGDK